MIGEEVLDLGGPIVKCQKEHPHDGAHEYTNGPEYVHRVTITWQRREQPAQA